MIERTWLRNELGCTRVGLGLKLNILHTIEATPDLESFGSSSHRVNDSGRIHSKRHRHILSSLLRSEIIREGWEKKYNKRRGQNVRLSPFFSFTDDESSGVVPSWHDCNCFRLITDLIKLAANQSSILAAFASPASYCIALVLLSNKKMIIADQKHMTYGFVRRGLLVVSRFLEFISPTGIILGRCTTVQSRSSVILNMIGSFVILNIIDFSSAWLICLVEKKHKNFVPHCT